MKKVENIVVGRRFNINHNKNEMISINSDVKSQYCNSCKNVYYYNKHTKKAVCGHCGETK